MMNEWKEVSILDVAPITSKLVDPKDEKYNSMILIAPDHIQSESGQIIAKATAREQNAISGKYLVKKGDVIYSKIRPYLKKVCIAPEDCLCSADMYPFSCTEKINSKYLQTILLSKQFTDYANSCSARTGIPKINRDDIALFFCKIPPIPEQEKIAETLSIWDSAIEKTEKLIALEEKKLSAFAIKLFSGKSIFQTKNICLTDLLKEKSDLSTGLEEVFSVSVHKGLVNQIEHLGRSFAAANTDNYNLVKFGYLVYTKSPTGDFPYGIVKQSSIKKDVIVSPLYGVYEPVMNEIGLIIEFFFESPIRCKNYLYPLIQKGAKNTISISNQDFLKGKINFPENEKDLIKIADYIRLAKEYISLLKKQLEQYKLQKQGLMQKLLTGEWRAK